MLGHQRDSRAIGPIRVATGEHVQNRVIFKQLLQAEAIDVVQIDACRVGGVNENLAILLLAAKFGVPVCPHAGGVGLCEMVQHLAMFDFVAVTGTTDRRWIEYVDHLHEHFTEPVIIKSGRYVAPTGPGAGAKMLQRSIDEYRFPDGPAWTQVSDAPRRASPRLGSRSPRSTMDRPATRWQPSPVRSTSTSSSAATAACSIDGTIVVQTVADTTETEELLELAATTPLVARCHRMDRPRLHPGIDDQLDRLLAPPAGRGLVGIRSLAQYEPDPQWLARPDVIEGLRAVARHGLTFDLLVAAAPTARRRARPPGQSRQARFVLDHLGKPSVATQAAMGDRHLRAWRRAPTST